MAYREINPTELAVDKPLTQQLFQALRDNSDAIAAAATGAPKIEEEAILNSGVTAGTNMIGYVATDLVYGHTMSNKLYITVAGTYRLQGINWLVNSSGAVDVKVFINGVEDSDFLAVNTSGGENRGATKDITLAVGDYVQAQAFEHTSSVAGMAAAVTLGVSDKSALGRGLLFSFDSTVFSPFYQW